MRLSPWAALRSDSEQKECTVKKNLENPSCTYFRWLILKSETTSLIHFYHYIVSATGRASYGQSVRRNWISLSVK
jgi:hypothetical protein